MRLFVVTLITFSVLVSAQLVAEENPPALNPFGKKPQSRADALPGYAELSDGTIHAGRLYLTRDVRLRIYDEQTKRQREVPFRVIKSLECQVKKEWMEKEWRFKENANNEKFFTGRKYPAREYLHTITLKDDRKITGPLSGVVYVDPYEGGKTQKFLMHKRQKGPVESELKTLVFLQKIELGEKAMQDAIARQQQLEASRRNE